MVVRVLEMDSLQEDRDQLREQLRAQAELLKNALCVVHEQADALERVAHALDDAGIDRDARPAARVYDLAAKRGEVQARLEMVARWIGQAIEGVDLMGRLSPERLADLITILEEAPAPPPRKEGAMKITVIRASRLKNLGSYENEKIDLCAEVQEGEDPIQAAGELQDHVRRLLKQPTRAEEAASRLLGDVDSFWRRTNALLLEAHEARREATRYNESAVDARREADALSRASEAEPEQASHRKRAERFSAAFMDAAERAAQAERDAEQLRAQVEARELEPEVQNARALLGCMPPRLWKPPEKKEPIRTPVEEDDIPFDDAGYEAKEEL